MRTQDEPKIGPKMELKKIVRGVRRMRRLERHYMKPRTAKSMELYDILLRRGYPEPFCDEITKNLNTDWTAQRMIGYLSHYKKLPMEEIADEMLAILSDRNRIMRKHELEETNARWNEYLNR